MWIFEGQYYLTMWRTLQDNSTFDAMLIDDMSNTYLQKEWCSNILSILRKL